MENGNLPIKNFEKIGENLYKIKGEEIMIPEKELIPIIIDVLEGKNNMSLGNYKLSKEVYLIGDENVPVENLILKIQESINGKSYSIEDCKVGENHYLIEGEVMYIDKYLLPIYDNIYFKGEYQEVESMDFEIQFVQFLKILPESISRVFHTKIAENYKFESYKFEREIDNLPDETNYKAHVNLSKWLLEIMDLDDFFYIVCPQCFSLEEKEEIKMRYSELDIHLFFEWFINKFSLKITNWVKENFINKLDYDEFVDNRLKERGYEINKLLIGKEINEAEEIEIIKNVFIVCINVVKMYRSEYDEWKKNIPQNGKMSDEVIFRENGLANKEGYFFLYYQYFDGYLLNQFFGLMNSNSLNYEDYDYIYDELRELGIDRYFQEKYEDYRKKYGGREICFCDINKSRLKDYSTCRLPMPIGFDDRKLERLHKELSGYVDLGQPLSFFLGSKGSSTDIKIVSWNGNWQSLKFFIKELYGKNDSGVEQNVPIGTWKIVSDVFIPKGVKVEENTLKTGKINLLADEELKISNTIKNIRELRWKE